MVWHDPNLQRMSANGFMAMLPAGLEKVHKVADHINMVHRKARRAYVGRPFRGANWRG